MDSGQHRAGRMGIGHDRELEEACLVNQNHGWQVDGEDCNAQHIAMVCCIIDIIMDIIMDIICRSCCCSCCRAWFCMSTMSFNCLASVSACLCSAASSISARKWRVLGTSSCRLLFPDRKIIIMVKYSIST